MVRVKTVTQPRDTGSDLVECNTLLAPIWYTSVHACRDVFVAHCFRWEGSKPICHPPIDLQALDDVCCCEKEIRTALVDEHLRLVLASFRLVVGEFLFGGVGS